MASTRRTRNVNKRFTKVNEEWHDKDAATTIKIKSRKRKISDMLGSQWSKDELERFYESYRKYGKDWRKVASAIRNNRSADMVEALYKMNKAYLSLPEGTATAVGLIAMMTDHYNILDGSQSDQESADLVRAQRRPQKRSRVKVKHSKVSNGLSPDLLVHPSSSADFGCLSFLKKKRPGDIFAGTRTRAVGKRTPRVPVSNMYSKDELAKFSSVKYGLKSDVGFGEDEGVHVAALALAEASKRGGSPQVSCAPLRRIEQFKSAPASSDDRKNVEAGPIISKYTGLQGDYPEGSLGSREAENADFTRDENNAIESEDEREACSATEDGASVRKVINEKDIEVVDSKPPRASKSLRKRNRQLFCGDESAALDALQTLADLSLNILLPASTVDSESSVKVKEERNDANANEKPTLNESTSYQKEGSKILGKGKGTNAIAVVDVVTRRSPKILKRFSPEPKGNSDIKKSVGVTISKSKKKRKPSIEKVSKSEHSNEPCINESKLLEVSVEEAKRPSAKARKINQGTPPPKQGKLIKPPDGSSSSVDIARNDLNGINEHNAISLKTSQPNKYGSRRKMNLQKELGIKEFKPAESVLCDPDKHALSLSNKTSDLKVKLSHCLLSRLLRRWCVYEWFYSAIDYPWFSKSEFVEYLNHVRLGHVPRLTRIEWGVIRSSLGKPRRLSKHFLQEEREKLEKYRESVRTTYAELRVGLREGLPTDLARPLSVGQHVIACHPKTREIHDGSILTVDRNRCRVQFDRPELGVEFVMDIDCMPLNPSENIPEALRRQNVMSEKFTSFLDTKLEDQLKDWNLGIHMKYGPTENLDPLDGMSLVASNYSMSNLIKQAKEDTVDATLQAKAAANEFVAALQQAMYNQPCTLAQIQAKEADVKALAELNRALDKKQVLLIELRHMNEVSGKQKDGDTIKDLEHFRKQYAMVLLQLRDVNDQVASALLYLRQRNSYHGNSMSHWLKAAENTEGPSGHLGSFSPASFVPRDTGSRVVEIVETSRRKAKLMVGSAVQAVSTIKDGVDAAHQIGEALDFVGNRNPTVPSSNISTARQTSPHVGLENADSRDGVTSGIPEPVTFDACDFKPEISSEADETLVPSELISSCVSTLLMIQACTERQYPPAEVAQILDSAVASLHPCCSRNLPIYREIESCMGIIKNQMLALIPTPMAATNAEAGM